MRGIRTHQGFATMAERYRCRRIQSPYRYGIVFIDHWDHPHLQQPVEGVDHVSVRFSTSTMSRSADLGHIVVVLGKQLIVKVHQLALADELAAACLEGVSRGRSFRPSLPTPTATAPEDTSTISLPLLRRSAKTLTSFSTRRMLIMPVS